MMGALLNAVAISCAIAVVLCAWKVVNMVWVRPRRLEKLLKKQGFSGEKYKVLFGDMKEISTMLKKAKSQPIKLSDGHGVLRRVVPFTHRASQIYGKNFVIWLGWRPRVYITDPELIKDILMNSNDFKKTRLNPLTKFLVTGVVSYDGDQWSKHRKILNPAFHVEKLKNMLPAFQISCSKLIGKWKTMVASRGSCELDVWSDLQALTCDVIARTSFGSSYEEGIHIFELVKEQAELILSSFQSVYIPGTRFLPTKRNRRMMAIDKEIRRSLRGIIETRLNAMRGGEGNYDDLLGIMLESNVKEVEQHGNKSHGISINEVIEECKLFYFAGQETTAGLLMWTMVLLSMHQEWQSRARDELFNLFPNKKLDSDGLNQLKIVTMILHEVMRLYPPVVRIARRIDKDVTVGGHTLPSGAEIGLPVMLLHYNKEIWGDDVEEFKPERFSGGVSKATKNQVTYFPFGWGPRICVGQNFAILEAKIALSMILQSFSFELSPSYVHAPHTVLTLQPQHGAHLILHEL